MYDLGMWDEVKDPKQVMSSAELMAFYQARAYECMMIHYEYKLGLMTTELMAFYQARLGLMTTKLDLINRR